MLIKSLPHPLLLPEEVISLISGGRVFSFVFFYNSALRYYSPNIEIINVAYLVLGLLEPPRKNK